MTQNGFEYADSLWLVAETAFIRDLRKLKPERDCLKLHGGRSSKPCNCIKVSLFVLTEETETVNINDYH